MLECGLPERAAGNYAAGLAVRQDQAGAMNNDTHDFDDGAEDWLEEQLRLERCATLERLDKAIEPLLREPWLNQSLLREEIRERMKALRDTRLSPPLQH